MSRLWKRPATFTTTLAIALASALVVGVAVPAAAPVAASERPGPVLDDETTEAGFGPSVTQVDDFTLWAPGVAVGGSGFADGAPTNAALVVWNHTDTVVATVRGTVHLDDAAGRCVRAEVTSYQTLIGVSVAHNTALSPTVCGYGDDDHRASDFVVMGMSNATRVTVTMQTQISEVQWLAVATRTFDYGPVIDLDQVSIHRTQFDLGTGPFVDGAPAEPATVTWSAEGYVASVAVRAQLSGSLYVHNAAGQCGRVTAKYYDHLGALRHTTTSLDYCVVDDDLHVFYAVMVPMEMSYLAEVKYVIEKKDNTGKWTTVGSARAERN
ncbi:MAG: hypothetical protein AB7L13_05830 [Acidimicrobiia bacterium]